MNSTVKLETFSDVKFTIQPFYFKQNLELYHITNSALIMFQLKKCLSFRNIWNVRKVRNFKIFPFFMHNNFPNSTVTHSLHFP